MKKIGIDARLYSQTGVGVYIRNFLHYLAKIKTEEFQFYVYLLPEDKNKFPIKDRFILRETRSKWHSLYEQIEFLRELYADKLYLMHFTYFSYPILYRRKFIATIHDLTPLLFKTGKASTKHSLIYNTKYQVLNYMLANQVKKSAAIITPAQTIKDQILHIYGEQYAEKIYPIYEGVDYEIVRMHEDERLRNIYKGPFFIYVGNFYPHKNVSTLVKAFSQIESDAKLILIGPKDYFYQKIKNEIADLGQEKRIILFSNPTREQLVFFYKHALALINPSLSEGFGLPLIEAAYFNLPIIASNIEIFKELWKDQFIRIHSESSEDIVRKIHMFLRGRPTFNYTDLLMRYSFANMAEQIFYLYKKL